MARLAFFDAHCHLQESRIVNIAPQLIRQASESGVKWLAVNGTSEEDWGVVKEMGETYTSVIPNFGLHPWWVPKRSSKWLETLREMLEKNPTAGVGEVGIDLGRRGKEIDEDLQIQVLEQQLSLARELGRPASVHCVRAIGPLQKLLLQMGPFPAGIIMHSFNGPAESVRDLLKIGAYFSLSGFFTSLKDSKAKNVLNQIPLDRMLLETDAPDALPKESLRSHLVIPSSPKEDCDAETTESRQTQQEETWNHPRNIQLVSSLPNSQWMVQKSNLVRFWKSIAAHLRIPSLNSLHISSLMGISTEDLASQSFENATRIFSFPGSKIL